MGVLSSLSRLSLLAEGLRPAIGLAYRAPTAGLITDGTLTAKTGRLSPSDARFRSRTRTASSIQAPAGTAGLSRLSALAILHGLRRICPTCLRPEDFRQALQLFVPGLPGERDARKSTGNPPMRPPKLFMPEVREQSPTSSRGGADG